MTTLTQTYHTSETQRLGRRLPHIVGGAKFSVRASKLENHAQFPSVASPVSPRRSLSMPIVSKLPRLSRKRESSDGSTNSKASSEAVADTDTGAPLSITRSRSAPDANVIPDSPDSSTNAAMATETQQSAESRPATPTSSRTLTFPHVASLFVKLRRVQRKSKAHHIDSNSGVELLTHASLKDGGAGSGTDSEATFKRLARLEILDMYNCADGVDVAKVLRASRSAILERASPLHANILVDEQWSVSICGPKHRSDGSFRTHVRYAATACAAPSLRDPGQPVAFDDASGVPGLMTIVSRETVHLNVVEVFPTA